MTEPRAGGYREPLAGESLDEYEAALTAAEDEVVAAIWRATLRDALASPAAGPTDPRVEEPVDPDGANPTET
ncbi:hypothetical protein [Cellulomonas chitinilytica]|nr:hypothetical protein [Cellulomonas chitinilytica]